ncbi:hypothetical protein PMSD_18365 [Paenibacillus macquariensis subsp. defensor]|nr:hypothetical protein PMSD_18365 [Paenibacillus macquariensis subsp. defensor]
MSRYTPVPLRGLVTPRNEITTSPRIRQIVEAKNLILNSGYGGSYDDTQAGATGGRCVKFVHNTAGNSKATYGGTTGKVIENLLGNKAGQYTVRCRLKKSGSTDLSFKNFAIVVQNGVPFKVSKDSVVDAVLELSAGQISTDWAWHEVSFYWDGIQPIELWTGKTPGGDPAAIFWEDQVVFISADGVEKNVQTLETKATLDISGDNSIRIRRTHTPTSAIDTGKTGDICWDANFMYVCIADSTWKRTPIATW